MSTQPLLIEIGTEEIPAGVAPHMGKELFIQLDLLLNDGGFAPENLRLGVTPRRLLVHATACHEKQHDFRKDIWGPPEHVAYADGKPTKAAEGFAKKTGLSLDDFELADKGDGKAKYMKATVDRKGLAVIDVLAEAMPGILRKLPSPKQMQWNEGDARSDAFIRPVRWIVARLGDEVIPFSFAGVEAGKVSCGHRVHGSSGELDVTNPFGWLEKQCVVADRDKRISIIKEQLEAAAKAEGVAVVSDDGLVEEVADLTEWPQAIVGRYDEDYLKLPEEVSRIELKNHQRCFAAKNKDGSVSNVFFAVANIESKDTQAVAQGNERVVNARLADAAFYFERDPKESLEERVERLNEVVFQEGLGMVGDQVNRLRGFVLNAAVHMGADANEAQRAAYLCKSDLSTGLVGEFPELQGYMGGVYARMQPESDKVADAIAEHYQPAGADDALPSSIEARAIAIAERIDKLLGYFHLGKVPTARADPFGLRRAAIGLIHLLSDTTQPVEMTLSKVIKEGAHQWNEQRVTVTISEETSQQVKVFIIERLLGMAGQLQAGRSSLEAALGASIELPLHQTIGVARLLDGFADSETGQAVAAANKRIANILKKTELKSGAVNASLFVEDAESALFDALQKAEAVFPEAPEAQLEVLAGLREPVDQFFDDVMVMADDEKLCNNRLALLARLRELFLRLADVSKL